MTRATTGASKALDLDVNSFCVARAPGEAIGGIMTLTHADGRAMTVNVEYNQIDALLKATVEPRGDVARARDEREDERVTLRALALTRRDRARVVGSRHALERAGLREHDALRQKLDSMVQAHAQTEDEAARMRASVAEISRALAQESKAREELRDRKSVV